MILNKHEISTLETLTRCHGLYYGNIQNLSNEVLNNLYNSIVELQNKYNKNKSHSIYFPVYLELKKRVSNFNIEDFTSIFEINNNLYVKVLNGNSEYNLLNIKTDTLLFDKWYDNLNISENTKAIILNDNRLYNTETNSIFNTEYPELSFIKSINNKHDVLIRVHNGSQSSDYLINNNNEEVIRNIKSNNGKEITTYNRDIYGNFIRCFDKHDNAYILDLNTKKVLDYELISSSLETKGGVLYDKEKKYYWLNYETEKITKLDSTFSIDCLSISFYLKTFLIFKNLSSGSVSVYDNNGKLIISLPKCYTYSTEYYLLFVIGSQVIIINKDSNIVKFNIPELFNGDAIKHIYKNSFILDGGAFYNINGELIETFSCPTIRKLSVPIDKFKNFNYTTIYSRVNNFDTLTTLDKNGDIIDKIKCQWLTPYINNTVWIMSNDAVNNVYVPYATKETNDILKSYNVTQINIATYDFIVFQDNLSTYIFNFNTLKITKLLKGTYTVNILVNGIYELKSIYDFYIYNAFTDTILSDINVINSSNKIKNYLRSNEYIFSYSTNSGKCVCVDLLNNVYEPY